MQTKHEIPVRADVPAEHRWNLGALYADEAAWESDFKVWERLMDTAAGFRGTLGSSSDALFSALEAYREFSLLGERLGYYAHLRQTEDEGDSTSHWTQG